jgi:hypothetical protein
MAMLGVHEGAELALALRPDALRMFVTPSSPRGDGPVTAR